MGKPHSELGVGAMIGVKLKNLRPRNTIKLLFKNFDTTDTLEGVRVLGMQTIQDRGKPLKVLRIEHARFKDEEVFVPPGSTRWISSGPPEQFFRA